MTNYKFSVLDFESKLPELLAGGVTELCIHDEAAAGDKKQILKIFNILSKKAPDIFLTILVKASVIDREVVQAASSLFCSLDIPVSAISKGGKLLFDKKFYASKAKLLNDYGIVFGFQMDYAVQEGDSLKLFMERLDFVINQYPNHVDFPQTEASVQSESKSEEPKVTGLFSAKDIRYARDVAFACRAFYSAGRAVTWMLSVLKPLKIHPSKFFADAAEWMRCNNCDFKSGYIPENEAHINIEKMQLLFLDEKYEEKSCDDLIPLVHDIVVLNGAISRLAGENEESILRTSYHPDDLLSPEAFDLISFVENVCMLDCKVRVFEGQEGPDYEIL